MSYKSRRIKESVFKFWCRILTWSCLLLLVTLFFHLCKEGFEYFDWDFLNSYPSRRVGRAGIKAGLWGSLWLMGANSFNLYSYRDSLGLIFRRIRYQREAWKVY